MKGLSGILLGLLIGLSVGFGLGYFSANRIAGKAAIASSRSATSVVAQRPQPRVQPPTIRAEKFTPLYRAAKSFETAIDLGIAPNKYDELLQTYRSELNISTDQATTAQEKQLASLYNSAVEPLQDFRATWDVLLTWGQHYAAGVDVVTLGVLRDDDPGRYEKIAAAMKTYGLKPKHRGEFYTTDALPILNKAVSKMKEADAIYVSAKNTESDERMP